MAVDVPQPSPALRQTAPQPPVSRAEGSDPAESDPGDWPAQAADSIVELVDTVRSKTTDRVVLGARWVVFGFLIFTLVLTALISLVVGLLRFVQVTLVNLADSAGWELSHARAVWISYLFVGMVFVGVGSLIWHQANRQAARTVTDEGASS